MVRTPSTPQPWKVGEWLKPADCKSAPLRVRRFESVPSNKMEKLLTEDGLAPLKGHLGFKWVATITKDTCPKGLCDGPCSVVHLQQVDSKLCPVKSTTTVSVEGGFPFYYYQVIRNVKMVSHPIWLYCCRFESCPDY